MDTKVLFLLKKDQGYGGNTSKAGLTNSSLMTAIELSRFDIADCDVRSCIDGNGIDKEVATIKPDLVILEALWVTPDKLQELVKLHPKVKFVVRIHSEIPFLAYEGVAIEWIKKFKEIDNVYIAFNSFATSLNFMQLVGPSKLGYLPNVFEQVLVEDVKLFHRILHHRNPPIPDVVNIGCFGAIRPMKNQLMQAFAAIEFARLHGKRIKFHINFSRVEDGGSNPLRNIRALFQGTDHELVEHTWMPRTKFLTLVSTMDIGMQVSMTESFNIVTADFVLKRVPIVVSPTIDWMPDELMADPESVSDIAHRMELCFKNRTRFEQDSRLALNKYNGAALATWIDFLKVK